MKLFEKICLGAATAGVFFLLIEAGLFLREERIDSDKITAQTVGLALPIKNALAQIASAAKTFAQVGAQERNAFQEQQNYFRGLTSRTNTLFDTANTTLTVFNATVLPRVAAALDGTTTIETSAARDLMDTTIKIDGAIDALRPMIDGGIRATTAAAAAMSDPAIHETLAHVDGVAGNLDATSGDIRTFVHRETTPVRGTWNVIKSFLMEFAGPAAQVATAAK
jgi:ABC-type transporter Mla subunit MlaD